MADWIACGEGYIEADVIRWQEPVWPQSKARRGKIRKLGDRLVTAEVLREADENGWVRLLVLACEIVAENYSRKPVVLLLQKGAEIRRKHTTLQRALPQRLPWSDESARSIAASKFLGNHE